MQTSKLSPSKFESNIHNFELLCPLACYDYVAGVFSDDAERVALLGEEPQSEGSVAGAEPEKPTNKLNDIANIICKAIACKSERESEEVWSLLDCYGELFDLSMGSKLTSAWCTIVCVPTSNTSKMVSLLRKLQADLCIRHSMRKQMRSIWVRSKSKSRNLARVMFPIVSRSIVIGCRLSIW